MLEVGLLAFRWSNTLFGSSKCDEEENHTYCTEDSHKISETDDIG